jgi:hypothetical protein
VQIGLGGTNRGRFRASAKRSTGSHMIIVRRLVAAGRGQSADHPYVPDGASRFDTGACRTHSPDDRPPDLPRLEALQVWHALWLERIDRKIDALRQQEAERQHGEQATYARIRVPSRARTPAHPHARGCAAGPEGHGFTGAATASWAGFLALGQARDGPS